MSTVLLEASEVSQAFDYTLFTDINFTLLASQSKAIIGRSGSGKSTLLHILSTFIKPNHGKVTLLGHDLYTLKDDAIEALRRYDIGIIFQFHYLFKGMSTVENIEVASMLSGEVLDEAILDKLEIKELMHQRIGELSGGQQQRISIARVLSKKPRIIFADEPTGNLDNITATLVMDVLLNYVKENEAGLLLVTHDENMAKKCGDAYKLENRVLKKI